MTYRNSSVGRSPKMIGSGDEPFLMKKAAPPEQGRSNSRPWRSPVIHITDRLPRRTEDEYVRCSFSGTDDKKGQKQMLHTLRKDNKTMRGLLVGALAVFAVMMLSMDSRVAAQDGAHQVKVPQTAQDHYALADHYKKEAAELRGEIQKHNYMLAEYSKGVAKNVKEPGENGYVKTMRLHCEKYIKAAGELLTEDEDLAKFHTLRGKELEGK
jgi:hypothetical protein